MGRLSDSNLVDHSLRCAFAAGDLRAHGALLLEELPADLTTAIGEFLFDATEVEALTRAVAAVSEFFEGRHWFESVLPRHDEHVWVHMMHTCEFAKQALMTNGMPPWSDRTYHAQG
jgi:hypothetical protein